MRIHLVIIVLLFATVLANAQNVGINATGATPNASAMLDINSTTLGLLIPRVTSAQKTAMNPLAAAAQGLIVYQIDGVQGFYYNTSTTTTPVWSYLTPAGWTTVGNTLTGTLPATPNEWVGTINAADWVVKTNSTERMRVQSTGNVGIGTSTPTRAILEQYGVVGQTTAIFGGNTTGVSFKANWPGMGFNGYQDGTNWRNIAVGYAAGMDFDPSGGGLYFNTYSNSGAANGIITGSTVMTILNGGNVGIGTTPNASAQLDITSTSTGLLIPRVSLTGANAASPITSPLTSLLVYNIATVGTGTTSNDVTPGYYYWNGTKWISLSGGVSGNNWALTGNSGTTVGTNFIGTTDAHALEFKVNSLKAGYIDYNAALANTAFGYQAANSTTGAQNTAVGYQALFSNTTGINNTAVGYKSLYTNSASTGAGINNTALGVKSLYSNTSSDNTALGYQTLADNTTGQWNTGIGEGALQYNVAGTYNVAVGYYALRGVSTTSQSNNVGLGYEAGLNNNSGGNNVFVGNTSGYTNSSGSNNLFLGNTSGYKNYAGSNNIFMGFQSGYNNDIGQTATTLNGLASNNLFLGNNSGYNNTTGNLNIFLGHYSGWNNTTGYQNLFMGDSAGYSNHVGIHNVFLGFNTGHFNDAGSAGGAWDNVFIGNQSGYNNTTGTENIFLGTEAGSLNTIGSENIFIGYIAGQGGGISGSIGSNGNYNCIVGTTAGFQNTGGGNTFLGSISGMNNTTGATNTFIGMGAGGTNDVGTNNTILGSYADLSASNFSNACAIGANAIVGASNAVVLGGAYGSGNAVNVGIGTSTPNQLLSVYGNTNWGQIQTISASGAESDIGFSDGTSNIWAVGQNIGTNANTHKFSIFSQVAYANLLTIQPNGNVGIGNYFTSFTFAS